MGPIYPPPPPPPISGRLPQTGRCGKRIPIFPKAENAGQRFSQEYSKVLLRDILTEDGTTLEHIQEVSASGAKTHMPLQHQEICIRHAYRVVEGYVGFYGGW